MNVRYILLTVKHGGGNIKVWVCFSRNRGGSVTPNRRGQHGPVHEQRHRATCLVSRVDILARQLTETHIWPCYGLVPNEKNFGYGVAISKSRPESHRASLERTGPSMKRQDTTKSKRFVSNAEEGIEKNNDICSGQTGGLHGPPLRGRSPKK
jgi:hypothetical protein